MAVCSLCQDQVADQETHLRTQHGVKVKQLLDLVKKIRDERKFKAVKRFIASKSLKKQSKLTKHEVERQAR